MNDDQNSEMKDAVALLDFSTGVVCKMYVCNGVVCTQLDRSRLRATVNGAANSASSHRSTTTVAEAESAEPP
jgi:hypothetical protein